MEHFDHIDASSLEEATRLFKRYRNRARLIAGGTDLLSVLKDRVLPEYPEKIINIKTIPGLDYISENGHGLRIGPMTKLSKICASPLIKEKYFALAQAAESIATPEIRNVATIGGNLCQEVRCWYYRYPNQIGGAIICKRKDSHSICQAVAGDNRYHSIMDTGKCVAVCPSDIAVALSSLDATVQVTGPLGSRLFNVVELYTTFGNSLKAGEIISEIQIPECSGSKQKFIKFALRTPVDFAIASVASVIKFNGSLVQDVCIYLGAVAYRPARATIAENIARGKCIDEKIAREAADAQVAVMRPLSRNSYKLEISRSLIKQALLC